MVFGKILELAPENLNDHRLSVTDIKGLRPDLMFCLLEQVNKSMCSYPVDIDFGCLEKITMLLNKMKFR